MLNMSIRFRKTARGWYKRTSEILSVTAYIDVTDQQFHFAFDVHFLPWLYSVLIDFLLKKSEISSVLYIPSIWQMVFIKVCTQTIRSDAISTLSSTFHPVG